MKDLQKKVCKIEKPKIDLPDEEKQRLIRQCQKDPSSAGRTLYQKFLDGKKLTPKEAVLAKCYDCDGGHSDGRYDCEVPSCPLYQLMPYRGKQSPYSLRAQSSANHE